MPLLYSGMAARSGNEVDTYCNNRPRPKVLSDGGETLCAACGEAYAATIDECPDCGYRHDPDRKTNEHDTGSAKKASNSSEEVKNPNVLRNNDGPSEDQTPERGVTGNEREDTTTVPPSEYDSTGPGPDQKYCSTCGDIIGKSATQCPHCGADPSKPEKSQLMAAGLSFFITGAGQVYNGDLQRGVGFFLAMVAVWFFTVITVGLGALLLPIVWGWAVYDAYKGATQR